ncbi:hypothetical protein RAS12_30270 (plasmid) [Achromobacter seleniivolatilans]|uniref:Uncharacterized protein n=1 Tax=Achromobacter seleniivolatilans TaxID=3047478 RepID=A0ABY9MAP2_9BURK|nr:hypothetical protein [Achromobacter sp. R39]WMD23920.1 hypothetical protein RAS12_30270 [Achromobacter sp. R39]
MKDLFLSIRRGPSAVAAMRRPKASNPEASASSTGPLTVRCESCGIAVPTALAISADAESKKHQCELCASYSTAGEKDSSNRGRDMATQSLVAVVPEICATDMNLLHWALAVALEDPSERERAMQVSQRLQARMYDAKHGYGSMRAPAYREAMGFLSDGEYAMRDVTELRLVFSPALMQKLQAEVGQSHGEFMNCDRWTELTQSTRRLMVDGPGDAEPK